MERKTRLATLASVLKDNHFPQEMIDIVAGYTLTSLALVVEWMDALRDGDLPTLKQMVRLAQIQIIPFTETEYQQKIDAFVQKGLVIDQRYINAYRKGKYIDKEEVYARSIPEWQRLEFLHRDARKYEGKSYFHLNLIDGVASATIQSKILSYLIRGLGPQESYDIGSFLQEKKCPIDLELKVSSPRVWRNPNQMCTDLRLGSLLVPESNLKDYAKCPNISTLGHMVAASDYYHCKLLH